MQLRGVGADSMAATALRGLGVVLAERGELERAAELITQAKAGAKGAECTFSATKPYSTCMGMQFNISVATKVGGVIHNPYLVEQLMLASINQMKKDYSLTVTVDMTPMFKRGVIVSEGGRYASLTLGAGKRAQIEYVSANPTGPIHVGNGRGAAIGSTLFRSPGNSNPVQ